MAMARRPQPLCADQDWPACDRREPSRPGAGDLARRQRAPEGLGWRGQTWTRAFAGM